LLHNNKIEAVVYVDMQSLLIKEVRSFKRGIRLLKNGVIIFFSPATAGYFF